MERTYQAYGTLAAVAACSSSPFAPEPSRILQMLSLSVGQRADITPNGVGYDSLPALSSSAVGFLAMDRLTLYDPGGGRHQVQVFHFAAMAPGQTVVTLRYAHGAATVQDTIQVQAAVPHGAFIQVSAGFFLRTCGVTTRGAGYRWGGQGTNSTNTFGDYATPFYSAPVAVPSGLIFAAISGGTFHTCGLTTGGAAYCWGDSDYGELGIGNTTFSSTPVAVTGGLTFVQLSTGYFHACGLTAGGQAYCWGGSLYGELGNGTTTRSLTPVAVVGRTDVRNH